MELRECSVFIKRQLIVYLSPAMSTVDLCRHKLCSPSVGVTFVNTNLAKWESPHSKANDPLFIFKSFGLFLADQVPIQAGGVQQQGCESKAVTVTHLVFFQGFVADVCSATWAARFSRVHSWEWALHRPDRGLLFPLHIQGTRLLPQKKSLNTHLSSSN